MEAAAVEPTLGMNVPMIAASNIAVRRGASVNVSGPKGVTGTAVVPRPVVTRTPMRVIPRAHADEYATHKVVWTPIAVRRTGVRIIGIVAVSADRFRSDVHGAYANAYANLCMRATSSGKEQNPQQSCIF